jgi:penicillin-binding protein 2
VLSIDSKLQLLAEKTLGDLDGAVVALDPRNGEVLALVSKPGFDPAPFVEGIDNTSYQALLNDPDRPLYNRALLGTYPPGSTIKPFMALTALEYGAMDPNRPLYCSGTFYLPGSEHKYRCWKRHGHGPLNMEQAIARSCDVYFYQVAQALGIDHITELLSQFGYGEATGIDIPNEKSGLLPSRDWKRKYHHQVWFPGETLIVGIGQGYWQVTPMQLAQATERLAMRGIGYKPHLVHSYEDPLSHKVTGVAPEELPPVKVDDAGYFDHIIAGMHDVTQTVGGTAYSVFHDAPYTAGAKTGTAQVTALSQGDEEAPKQNTLPVKFRDHALFIAFAPIEAPQIVVAVIAEHGGHGGSVAAPVARVLMDQWLLGKVLYNVPPAPPAPVVAPPTLPAPSTAPTPPAEENQDDDNSPDETTAQ